MKKTKIDRSIDTEALGFQVRESYKTARTNIAYSIFKKGCKKVAFTSSTKGEGKTVTSINVASALAQQVGTKVIVVECDLRRPRVNTALKITPTPGLTNYLNEECSLEDIVKDTKIENLKAITYGAIPPNPSELLASESGMPGCPPGGCAGGHRGFHQRGCHLPQCCRIEHGCDAHHALLLRPAVPPGGAREHGYGVPSALGADRHHPRRLAGTRHGTAARSGLQDRCHGPERPFGEHRRQRPCR